LVHIEAPSSVLVKPCMIGASSGQALIYSGCRIGGFMNRRNKLLFFGGLLLTGAVAIAQLFAQGQSKSSTVTPADYLRWKTEFKNWGRWGQDDERGTTNLITPAKIVSVAKLVKTGQVISLAHPVPQKTEADVPETAVFHRTTLNIGTNSA